MNKARLNKALKIFGHLIFWGWNILFILLVSIGNLSVFGPWVFRSTSFGLLPFEFSLMFSALLLLPPLCLGIGLWKFRRDSGSLLKLFYGVEVPLMVMFAFRLIMIRQLTPASTYFLAIFCLGIVSFAATLFIDAARSKWHSVAKFSLTGLSGFVGLYTALLASLYIIPLGVGFLTWLISFEFLEMFRFNHFVSSIMSIYMLIQAALVIGTGGVLVVAPVIMVWMYLKSAIDQLKIVKLHFPIYAIGGSVFASVALVCLGFVITNQQPHSVAFKLLEGDRTNPELAHRDSEIRKGLLNAYLAPFRYMSTNRGRETSYLWEKHLGNWPWLIDTVQSTHDILASPFVYDGENMVEDQKRAAKLYKNYFDGSIQDLEQKIVTHAQATTYSRNQLGAGIVDRDQTNVHLREQDISYVDNGGVVKIRIHEVLENRTSDRQEVLYHFRLPEDAVVTGVWLGKDKEFAYQVSPRGAAQKVYRAEVQRRVDPALIEQVGPNQYRFRVFPIPPSIYYPNEKVGRMDVWWEYQVVGRKELTPFPQLLEKRNIFWNDLTERTLNEGALRASEDWFPSHFSMKADAPNDGTIVQLPNGAVSMHRRPKSAPPSAKIQVLIDGSYSMKAHQDRLREQLKGIATMEQVEVYFAGPSSGSPEKFEGTQFPHFNGTWKYAELVNLTKGLPGADSVKGYIILTDDNPFDKLEDWEGEVKSTAPVWMVPVNAPPVQYERKTFDALVRKGGGETGSLREALFRIRLKVSDPEVLYVSQNWIWRRAKKEGLQPSSSPLRQLASAKLILGQSAELGGSLKGLDQIHKIAKDSSVVSPFSSMIVLVDDRQKKALKKAESEVDRFDRVQESGEEILIAPPGTNLGVGGVPEPHEWALIFMALLIITYHRRQQLCQHPKKVPG